LTNTQDPRTLLGGIDAATSVNSSHARARLWGSGLPRVWRTSCMYSSSRSSGRFRPCGEREHGAAFLHVRCVCAAAAARVL
jgi:hypothetical protein